MAIPHCRILKFTTDVLLFEQIQQVPLQNKHKFYKIVIHTYTAGIGVVISAHTVSGTETQYWYQYWCIPKFNSWVYKPLLKGKILKYCWKLNKINCLFKFADWDKYKCVILALPFLDSRTPLCLWIPVKGKACTEVMAIIPVSAATSPFYVITFLYFGVDWKEKGNCSNC